jgi:hypothetical protein
MITVRRGRKMFILLALSSKEYRVFPRKSLKPCMNFRAHCDCGQYLLGERVIAGSYREIRLRIG